MRYAMMVLLFCYVLAGCTGCGSAPSFSVSEDLDIAAESTERKTGDDADDAAHKIYVDICGEVEAPGVYCLDEGARVCDAVAAAGGFTPDAAGKAVNQARTLQDGEQVLIPSAAEAEEGEQDGNGTGMSDGLVNINTADASGLMTLPGIGEAKAADIISYRTEHGNFQKKEDLMQVPGIKEGLYQKLEDKIKV